MNAYGDKSALYRQPGVVVYGKAAQTREIKAINEYEVSAVGVAGTRRSLLVPAAAARPAEWRGIAGVNQVARSSIVCMICLI